MLKPGDLFSSNRGDTLFIISVSNMFKEQKTSLRESEQNLVNVHGWINEVHATGEINFFFDALHSEETIAQCQWTRISPC